MRWVEDVFERLAELVVDLGPDDLARPLPGTGRAAADEIVDRVRFAERFSVCDLFGEPAGPRVAHLDDHLTRVRERIIGRLVAQPLLDTVDHAVVTVVVLLDDLTEDLTAWRQWWALPPPERMGFFGGGEAMNLTPGTGDHPGDASVPGGMVAIGAARHAPFVLDAEKWAHQVLVHPFLIAMAPVTQAAFAAFVDDGGYGDERLWSPAGRTWCTTDGAAAPAAWRRADGGWERRDFDRWLPLEPHRPVAGVNRWEAEAWCAWAGRRLPTDVEWEVAARGSRDMADPADVREWPWGASNPGPVEANLAWFHRGTVDVAAFSEGDGPFAVRQLIGNVWEWTAEPLAPYPHYERDAHPWAAAADFGTAGVVRGGSWATRPRAVRSTRRRAVDPDRRDAFTGFRTAVS